MQYRHGDGSGTTVPNHPGRDISPILPRQIARDIGMTAEEFITSPMKKRCRLRNRLLPLTLSTH
jgi:hypothetical protein